MAQSHPPSSDVAETPRQLCTYKQIVYEAFHLTPSSPIPSWVKPEWAGKDEAGNPCLVIPTKAQRTMYVTLGRVLLRRCSDGNLRHISHQEFIDRYVRY